MENPISISNLNDFVFCPASIYFHMLDADTEKLMYHDKPQINGSAAHQTVDNKRYSNKNNVLQGISVYSEEYNFIGCIDVFDLSTGIIIERKKTIKTIYDGYIFQLYAQCIALREMGFKVNGLKLHSMTDNKNYEIKLPENDKEMFHKFNKTIEDIRNFNFKTFVQGNIEKCIHCIYEPLCSFRCE